MLWPLQSEKGVRTTGMDGKDSFKTSSCLSKIRSSVAVGLFSDSTLRTNESIVIKACRFLSDTVGTVLFWLIRDRLTMTPPRGDVNPMDSSNGGQSVEQDTPGVAVEGTPLFHEVQRFRQPWVWVILVPIALGLIGFFTHVLLKQLVFGVPVGEKPLSDALLLAIGVVTFVVTLGLIIGLYKARMVVDVTDMGVAVQFFPLFHRQTLGFEEIERCDLCSLPSIRARGGGGVQLFGAQRMITVRGDQGIELVLRDEGTLVLGSQRASELLSAIQRGLDAYRSTFDDDLSS